jgi:hypothetical protein
MTFKVASHAAVLVLSLLGGSALAGENGTPQKFSALRNVPAEALTSEEMDKVQGKAFAGFTQDSRYLYWWDTGSSIPLAAFDTTSPQVQQAWINIYSFGGPQFAPAYLMWDFLVAADPRGPTRTTSGCNTSSGVVIPGFTVGIC